MRLPAARDLLASPKALAILSGVLVWLAVPPHGALPIGFVMWTPLLIALRGRSWREALALGWMSGFVTNVLGWAWLPGVLKTFGDLPFPACVLLASMIWAYSAGRTAVACALVSIATRPGAGLGGAFCLALVATETFFPLLFPWTAGLVLHGVPAFTQVADLGGAPLVGVPLAAVSALVAELVLAGSERRPLRRATLAWTVAIPVASLVYGWVRAPQIERWMQQAPAARIGMVQGNIPHTGARIGRSLEIHRAETAALAKRGEPLDLVVWPETALTSAIRADGLASSLRDMVIPSRDGASDLTMPVLTGALLARGDAVTNSAVLFNPDGRVLGIYDKVNPLLIGERVPFDAWLPQLHQWIPNAGHISPGTSVEPLVFGVHRISVLICYEDVLASFTNRVVSEGDPDLLVSLTNDAWFGWSSAAETHLALAKLRAVEHRRYLVHATNSGASAVVDPLGRTADETSLFTREARAVSVRWMHARTIYERVGDLPGWCAGAILVALACVSLRVQRRGPPSLCRSDTPGRDCSRSRCDEIRSTRSARARHARPLRQPRVRDSAHEDLRITSSR